MVEMNNLAEEVRGVFSGKNIAIITDSNVGPLYSDDCRMALLEAGYSVTCHQVAAGEESKTGEVYLKLLEELAEIPLTREDGVLALGGGVVGDLAGFVAATYMRGIDVIQVPTSLLAMVDSSIGGKTGINLKAGKNQAGAFHKPKLTYRDVGFLETLPLEVFRDGLAEVVKCGMIGDPEIISGLEVLSLVGIEAGAKAPVTRELIDRAVAVKEKLVEEDLFDKGNRQLLNFGHTVGHALEKLSGYSISHGTAVAKGMSYITELSVKQGWCDRALGEKLNKVLLDLGFDLSIDYPGSGILEAIKNDKKRRGDRVTLVIPREIGNCELKEIALYEGN